MSTRIDIVLLLLAGCAAPRGLVISNARVFGHPAANAVRIEGERITEIGEALRGAEEIDARGGWLLPGFVDAHVHVESGGASLEELSLDAHRDLEGALRAVGDYARAHPELEWIVGRGFQYEIMPKGELPRAADLERVAPGRAIFLESYDGHAAWVSAAALARVGIDRDTKDPEDGKIVRDAEGQPTGALLEGAAALVESKLPAPDRAARKARLVAALDHLRALGVTTAGDIGRDPAILELYTELAAEGRLPIRIVVGLPLDGDLDEYARLRAAHAGPRLSLGFVKGFVDGVIEAKTAYMLTPYEASSERGRPLIPAERLPPLVEAAAKRGLGVALHAIGDGAVRLALDALSRSSGLRRVEHIEVIDPADLPRFAGTGVIASMQPFHANPFGPTPDAGVWSQNIGAERLRRSFAWRGLLDANALLAFGSDWPVMSADPLKGLAVAQTRQDEDGAPPEGWNRHQAIGADEAIRAYTEGAARALGREDLGRIAAGAPADLVLLGPGVEPSEPRTLWSGDRVVRVFVGGR